MATITAIQSGDWSDPDTWPGGVAPGPGDTARHGGFIVVVDIDVVVDRLDAGSSGGKFTFADGVTLEVTNPDQGAIGGSSSNTVVEFDLPAGEEATLIGNVKSAGAAPNNTLVVSGAGTFHMIGDYEGDSGDNQSEAFRITGAATVHATGKAFSNGVNVNRGGGRVTGPASVNWVGQLGDGVGRAPGLVVNNAAAIVEVTGQIFGGSATWGPGMVILSSASIAHTGDMVAVSAPAISGEVSHALDHVGECIASNNAPALLSTSPDATNILTGPFQNASNGRMAVQARKLLLRSDVPTRWNFRTTDLDETRDLLSPDQPEFDRPDQADVRQGVTYGPDDVLEGTMAVPPAETVAFGVPVDGGLGEAAIARERPIRRAAEVW